MKQAYFITGSVPHGSAPEARSIASLLDISVFDVATT